VLRTVALAGAALALVAVVAPRLAFSGGDEQGPGTSVATALPVGAAAAGYTVSTTVPGPGTTNPGSGAADVAAATTSSTTTTAAATAPTTTTTTAVPQATTTTTPVPDDGAVVDLVLSGLHSQWEGGLRQVFFPGDTIAWHFQVTNAGDEYLWGVFVYLELHGRVWCDAHRLDVGATTDCWIETRAWEGRHDAEAWATAWTDTRMVTDRLSYRLVVSPD
jgi:cytoskeletal protein RodZ